MKMCPMCGGDGIERCNNPDHEFIAAIGDFNNRCPCCGFDSEHRMMSGEECSYCNGKGEIWNSLIFNNINNEYDTYSTKMRAV